MQRPTTVLLCATTLLAIWIGASDALQCYHCNLVSSDVNACNECSDPVANSVSTCEGKSCVKSLTKCTEALQECNYKAGVILSRRCSPFALDSDYCTTISYSDGKAKITACGCSGDKCNVGESVLKSASLVVLATLAFVPYIATFIGTN